MPIIFNIIFIFILFGLNAVFAMYEIAMVSARKVRLEQRVAEGKKGAAYALELLKDPNQEYLSAIQIMITMIDTLAGGIGGAVISQPLAEIMKQVTWLAPIAETFALLIVVILITYFSIVLGELIPKRIAVSEPENVVTALSPMVRTLTRILKPLTRLLSGSTNIGLRVLRIELSPEPSITEEDVKGFIEEGRQTGVFDQAEQEMVDGVFRLTERRIDALMTPHTELDWINIEDEQEEIIHDIKASPYSRMPVAEGDLDRTIGMLHIKDLVGVDIYAPDFSVTNHIREALFLPGNMQAIKAFETFREKAVHQALVMDEFGGVLGLVTLYDVLESIVGAIPLNEFDLNQEVVLRPDGSWSFDGLLPIDVLKDLLKVEQFPEEDTADFQTLSGFIMNQLGHIPKVGQSFVWEQFSFEVLDMDGFRVDRVLVKDHSTEINETINEESET